MRAMDAIYTLHNGEDEILVQVDDYEVEEIDPSYQATMVEDFFVYMIQCHQVDVAGNKISELSLTRAGEIDVAKQLIRDVLSEEVY